MIWFSRGLLCGHRIGTTQWSPTGVNGGHTREGKSSLFLSLTLPIGSSTAGEGWGPLTPPAFLCRPSGALCCSALVITKAVCRSGDGLCSSFPCLLLLMFFLAIYWFSHRANAWAECLAVGTKCGDSSKAILLR